MIDRSTARASDTTLADRLLLATTPAAVATVLLELDAALIVQGSCVLWSAHWPDAMQSMPDGCVDAMTVVEPALAAVQTARSGGEVSTQLRILCDENAAVAVLYMPTNAEPLPDPVWQPVRARMTEVLAVRQLRDRLDQLAQTENLQRALFAIADMAGSDLDMPEMVRELHRIVGELMYAENFFIALFDPISDGIRFLHFVDTVDNDGGSIGQEFPLDDLKYGPTWWTIRQGRPLMGSNEQMQAQVSGPLQSHGAPSSDWLGVPMVRDDQVKGVVVVQSYLAEVGFTEADKALLGFVAGHILTALERKQVKEELERRVDERTRDLAQTNRDLESEVRERKRGARLQAALYQMAALAGSEGTIESFCAEIHRIIFRLLDVTNFYIALLSEDGSTVTFPFVQDVTEHVWPSRPLGRGMTDHVLRTGQIQMVGPARMAELDASGEIDIGVVGPIARVWLGVPLMSGDRAIGMLAVQSYTDENAYTTADAELLGFVATQLASSLQRRRENAKRERNERLQSTLYQIAALANTDETSELFFRHVHTAISGLLNADNFYIALLSESGDSLEFPYWADQHGTHPPPRPLGSGLTEYVLRRGQSVLVDGAQEARELVEAGEIGLHYLTTPTHCWLGTPLIASNVTLGAVAVQSYTPQVRYTPRDAELLTFVAFQLASSIQRRRAAEALHQAKLLLEQRVEARTHDLERLNRVYSVLSQINALIVRVNDRDELFREACRIAVVAGRFAAAHILIVNPDNRELELVASFGAAQEHAQKRLAHLLKAYSPEATREYAQLFEQRLPLVLNDFSTDGATPGLDDSKTEGLRASATLPLVIEDQTSALFILDSHQAGVFHEAEMELLHELAKNVAFAIDTLDKAEQLDYLAYFDQLTGLPNRRLFSDRTSQMLGALSDERPNLAVAYFNIEDLARINESLGKEAGDVLLRKLAARFTEAFASLGTTARVSEHSFAVALPGNWDELAISRSEDAFHAAILAAPFTIGGRKLQVSGKVGLAFSPTDSDDADTLLINAEAALRQARLSGERIAFFDAKVRSKVAETLALESDLRQAIERQEFVLHYQPKLSGSTRKIVAVEALMRWNAPGVGLVPPFKFIPLLEETGLILEVGEWALQQAVRDHGRWLEAGLDAPRIAVNVSAIQLGGEDFVDVVKQAIAGGGSPPGIDIEITESLIMKDIEGSMRKLQAIREMGVGISMDDFGTGYSSLAYLSRLPLTEVKIDRSFISAMDTDSNAMSLVSTIINLAHSLALKVVAEGVEKEDQAKFLRLLHCDEMQGYLFSKPVPFEQMTALIQAGTARASS